MNTNPSPVTPPESIVLCSRLIATESIELRDDPNNPNDGVSIKRYRNGYAIEVHRRSDGQNRLEFFIDRGDGITSAVLTLSAGPDTNFLEIRQPGDSGCINVIIPREGAMHIAPREEGPGARPVDLDIAPTGNVLVHGVPLEEFIRKVIPKAGLMQPG